MESLSHSLSYLRIDDSEPAFLLSCCFVSIVHKHIRESVQLMERDIKKSYKTKHL